VARAGLCFFPNTEGQELLLEDNAGTLLSGDLLFADDAYTLRNDLATERVEADRVHCFR
jgi:hypothetical protein